MFQATRLLRSTGLLEAVEDRGAEGMTAAEAATKTGLSIYAATVLLECGLSADLVAYDNGKFVITTLGAFIRRDEMTAVNMEFVHEVCYLGMHKLEDALRLGEPAGLRVFGEWKTVYEALAHLPENAKSAWLRFDHFYSDAAFPAASRIVLERQPQTMLDIGCNTGKWASLCLARSPELCATLVDLPGQLEMAMQNLREKGLGDRAVPCPVDVLDPHAELPSGFDAVWMSQFLVCFSEDEVRTILRRARRALRPGGRLWILDTFWDTQRFDAAAYCLINTSPYFTAIANGNSRMYRAEDILALAREEGLELQTTHERLGIYHSLLELAPG
ncbi:class I SAM-dependent methyltransferase [Polyangium sp. rjm3]|uniref:Class I SAM-dependent methyltransferase n=1 Tax=Polyangium mundeleinium TaxID=2995306 RepID=A0ABT5F0R9_9BACT|nr:class I SAM-dependent methyltransferase [Polyangium mundeleinium]MDC0747127.1 class I SAM-dependent methyltransferase [Polyangium mundeleinium]